MAEQKRTAQTLVALMRSTNWWPPDILSLHEGELRGQVVVLRKLDSGKTAVYWKLESAITDNFTFPFPFKRYHMVYVGSRDPKHCYVMVADVGNLSPLTDCCALIPFDPTNTRLTDKGRIQLGENAIAACLQAIGAWPDQPPLSSDNVISSFKEQMRSSNSKLHLVTLQPGQSVAYNPSEWQKQVDHDDEVMHGYDYFYTPQKVFVNLVISAGKEKHPETLDPFEDCFVCWEKPGPVMRLLRRLRGYPFPPDETVTELSRAALALHLASIGAWPPGQLQRDNAELRAALLEMLTTLESVRDLTPTAEQHAQTTRKLLAHLDTGALLPDAAQAIQECRAARAEVLEAIKTYKEESSGASA